MSDIKLFRIAGGNVDELIGTTDTIEKSVQTLFERNLDAFLGVRFSLRSSQLRTEAGSTPSASMKTAVRSFSNTNAPRTRTS
jgi:hypothetical protein